MNLEMDLSSSEEPEEFSQEFVELFEHLSVYGSNPEPDYALWDIENLQELESVTFRRGEHLPNREQWALLPNIIEVSIEGGVVDISRLPENLNYLTCDDVEFVNPDDLKNLRKLTRLTITSCDLALLPDIRGLHLEILELSDNNFTEIPETIFDLSSLEILTMNVNLLTSVSQDIGKLAKLIYLSLNHQDIETLPPEIGHLKNLTYLYLENNPLRSLPWELGECTKLRNLNVKDTGLPTLPASLRNAKLLTVEAEHSDLYELPKALEYLVQRPEVQKGVRGGTTFLVHGDLVFSLDLQERDYLERLQKQVKLEQQYELDSTLYIQIYIDQGYYMARFEPGNSIPNYDLYLAIMSFYLSKRLGRPIWNKSHYKSNIPGTYTFVEIPLVDPNGNLVTESRSVEAAIPSKATYNELRGYTNVGFRHYKTNIRTAHDVEQDYFFRSYPDLGVVPEPDSIANERARKKAKLG